MWCWSAAWRPSAPACRFSQSIPVTGSTPVHLGFDTVNGSGRTSVTSSAQGDAPPVGFKLGDCWGIYYELPATVGGYSSVTVCFSYDPAAFRDPANVQLFPMASFGPGLM